jgi:hypothetical protein
MQQYLDAAERAAIELSRRGQYDYRLPLALIAVSAVLIATIQVARYVQGFLDRQRTRQPRERP